MAIYQTLSKIDAYKLLAQIQERGVSIVSPATMLAMSDQVQQPVIDFINKYTITEADKFFETLRKLHNEKNHQLYTNILRDDLTEVGVLKCLSSYMTSACIQMESMDDPNKCIELRKSIGLEIVSEALYKYYNGIDYNMIHEAKEYIRSLINTSKSK